MINFTEKMYRKHLRRIKNIKWISRISLVIFILTILVGCSFGTIEVQEIGLSETISVIIIFIDLSLMVLIPVLAMTHNPISNYCYYNHEELHIDYPRLKRNEFLYTGYKLLKEDVIEVNFTYKNISHVKTFHLYDHLGYSINEHGFKGWERIFDIMTDELYMHKTCIDIVVKCLEEKEEEIFIASEQSFKNKVKELWS